MPGRRLHAHPGESLLLYRPENTLREVLEGVAIRILVKVVTDKQIEKLNEINRQIELACENNDVKIYQNADLQLHLLIIEFSGLKRCINYLRILYCKVVCSFSKDQ